MRHLLLTLFLGGCTTIGTFHNPACVFWCNNNGNDTITTNKETSLDAQLRRGTIPDKAKKEE